MTAISSDSAAGIPRLCHPESLERIVAVPPTDRRLSARIRVGCFGQLDLDPPSGWRVVQDIAMSASSIPSQRTELRRLFVRRFRTAHFSADRRSDVCQPVWPSDHGCASAASGYTRALRRCARVGRHLMREPCLTPAAAPPADRFGTLALPAHSRRESRRSGGRHRPAPGFRDHWAGSRTETI
jgi:hypothetical protein